MLVTLIFAALASLPLSIIFAIGCGVRYCRATPSHQRTPLLAFAFKVLLVGFLAYLGGAALGIGAFCAPAAAGNLCGLPGAVVIAPFCASVGIALTAWRLSRAVI